jgi:hypothetical protein
VALISNSTSARLFINERWRRRNTLFRRPPVLSLAASDYINPTSAIPFINERNGGEGGIRAGS